MIIIAGTLAVDADRRPDYLADQEGFIRTSRAKPGCLGFYLVADPIEPSLINLCEAWDSQESLTAHQASAQRPSPSAEILAEAVLKHHVDRSGPVFD